MLTSQIFCIYLETTLERLHISAFFVKRILYSDSADIDESTRGRYDLAL
jgi:hypothetical protein